MGICSNNNKKSKTPKNTKKQIEEEEAGGWSITEMKESEWFKKEGVGSTVMNLLRGSGSKRVHCIQ